MADKNIYGSQQLTVSDKYQLGEAIVEELINSGVAVEDLPIMGPESRMIQILSMVHDMTSEKMDTMYREASIIDCNFYTSLYSHMAQHDLDISLAHPSSMEMFVRLPLTEVITLGRLISNDTWEFFYTNANTVVINGYPFIAENDIYTIRVQQVDTDFKVKVHYTDSNGDRHLIPTQKILFNDDYYILFTANFLQVTKEIKYMPVGNRDIQRWHIQTKGLIYSFNCTYKNTIESPEIDLTPRNFYSRGQGNFIEYKVSGNKSLIFEHKYVPGGFRPEVNGIITCYLLTTTGENVKYKGIAKAEDVYPPEMNIYYEPVGEYFESKGGRIADYGKESIRNQVIKTKSARRRIDTEVDMTNYLRTYEGTSVFHPKLVLNNVKSRIFNIYTVLNFNESASITKEHKYTIPTNSLDIELDISRLPNRTVGGKDFYCLPSTMALKSTQGTEADLTVPLYGGWTSEPSEVDARTANSSDYLHRIPFILTYSKKENAIRTYMNMQVDVPYKTKIIEENDDDSIKTHIINTTLRMDDYEEYIDPDLGGAKKSIFRVKTEIRSDNEEIPLVATGGDQNFTATLTITGTNGYTAGVPLSSMIEVGEDQKYTLFFDFETDRLIYDKEFDLKYTDNGGVKRHMTVNVAQDMVLKLYYITGGVHKIISKYQARVEMFKDVTSNFLIQSNPIAKVGSVGNDIKFLAVPVVAHYFYEILENRTKVYNEVINVMNFMNNEIYAELDQYRSHGFTFKDLQETSFGMSCKFARTYGKSRFLQTGSLTFKPLVNLELRPTLYLRVLEDSFDKSTISEYLNNGFTSHEFLTSDLHMSTYITDMTNESNGAFEFLQMVNFDRYQADSHMIKHNGRDEKNDDVPEVIAIASRYNRERRMWEYDVTYGEI